MGVRFLVGLVVVAGCGAELGDPDQKSSTLPDSGLRVDAAIDSPPPIDARPCMGGTSAMTSMDGTCFILVTGPKTRNDAETECVMLGGHLATVKSAAHNAAIATLVAQTPTAFLGATDTATEGTYLWPDGSALTYTNWRSGEPNNGGGGMYQENCLVIQGLLAGVWDDRPCAPPPTGSGSYAFVCSY